MAKGGGMRTISEVKEKMEKSINIANEVCTAKMSPGYSLATAIAIVATKIYDEIKDLSE